MKIGIDLRTLLDKNYSGVSKYSYNLIKEILKQDKKNEYVFFTNSFSSLNPKIKEIIKNKEIIHTRFPNKIFNYGMQALFKVPQIDKTMGGVDIFFMPHINFISLSPGVKKIITLHDLSFLRNRDFFSYQKNIWHKSLNVKKIFQKFDRIVVVSENTKNDLKEIYKIPEEKIKLIYSGISSEFKKRKKSNINLIKTKIKYNLNSNFLFYLGNIEPRKNIEGIIKSYEKFLSFKETNEKYDLVLAGAWGWKYKNIKRTWLNSRYRDKIKFLGYVKEEDKKYLYNLADLFIYPSFYEGFGFPPLEALFSGTKVLSSFSSSLPEISKNFFSLVNPYDLNSIAKTIEIALNKPNISEINLKKIREYFLWENTAKKYINLFKLDKQ